MIDGTNTYKQTNIMTDKLLNIFELKKTHERKLPMFSCWAVDGPHFIKTAHSDQWCTKKKFEGKKIEGSNLKFERMKPIILRMHLRITN